MGQCSAPQDRLFFFPSRPYAGSRAELLPCADAAAEYAGRCALAGFAALHMEIILCDGHYRSVRPEWQVTELSACHMFTTTLPFDASLDTVKLWISAEFPHSTVRRFQWRKCGGSLRVEWYLQVEPGELMSPLPWMLAERPHCDKFIIE